MAFARTSVASGHGVKVSPCLSVRSHPTTGGVVASAGILALSLVTAPPDFDSPTTEVRAVRHAAVSLATATTWAALLERLISDHPQIVVPVAQVVSGAAYISEPAMTTPLASVRVEQPTSTPTQVVRAIGEPAIDPAINSQALNSTALASTTGPTLDSVLSVIFAVGFVVLFVALIPVAFVYGFIGYNIIDPILGLLGRLPIAGASTATAEANPTIAPAFGK